HTSELQSLTNLVCRLLLEKKTCARSEEHTSELQSLTNLVCRVLLGKNSSARRLVLCGNPPARHRAIRRRIAPPDGDNGRVLARSHRLGAHAAVFFFHGQGPPRISPSSLNGAFPE